MKDAQVAEGFVSDGVEPQRCEDADLTRAS
jgi:hypothetical protein